MGEVNKISTNTKVWIISELFHPDEVSTAYIMTSIAKFFAKDYCVNVICGPTGYERKLIETYDKIGEVNIYRTKCPNLNKNKILTRLFRQSIISFSILWLSVKKISKRDRVLIVTNPAIIIPLFGILNRLKKLHTTLLVHDVFPENLLSARILKSEDSIIYKILLYLFNLSYKSFNKIVVLGRDMQSVVSKKISPTTPIKIIENWADTDKIYPEEFQKNQIVLNYQLSSKIVFLFAGNMGRQQGLLEFVQILSLIKNKAIHFLFAGNGVLLPKLKEIVNNGNINNVTFLGSFPREEQNKFLNASHFGVVTLSESILGLGVPSKSYNILAAGKPILFIGNQNSEISLMIKEYNVGYTFSFKEQDRLIDFFENVKIKDYERLSPKCRDIAVSQYSKTPILKKFKDVVMH